MICRSQIASRTVWHPHPVIHSISRRRQGKLSFQPPLNGIPCRNLAVTVPNRDSASLFREHIVSALNATCGSGYPSLVHYLFVASTIYALSVTVFFLYLSTTATARGQSHGEESQQQDVVFLYSSEELKKSKGRGRQVFPSTMRKMSSSRMLVRVLLPLVAMYALLLWWSYEPDMLQLILPGSLKDGFSAGFNPQFFPNIKGIATLFSRVTTTASLWVHMLCINIFAAHTLMWKGINMGIPTQHTIILAMSFGPLGFLSHWITSEIYR